MFARLPFAGACLVFAAGIVNLSGALASETLKLARGERIVFLGDSITEAGAAPGGYVALVREGVLAKHKDLAIEILGAGISGNRVPDLEARLDKDVLAKKPTLVVIYIGVNDVWHSLNNRGTSREEYEQGLRRLVKKIHGAGARVALCTPSVIGEKHDGTNDLDNLLDAYAALSRKVARDLGAHLVDLRRQFVMRLRAKNHDNRAHDVLTTDGVHLNPQGNRFVADRLLEALGVLPRHDRLLRHVVLFKFKDDASKEDVAQVVEAFRQLPLQIPAIAGFETGTDVSVENRAQGFTHAFVVTFRDEAARGVYLPHPAHQEFIQLAGPRIDKVLVVDYWSEP